MRWQVWRLVGGGLVDNLGTIEAVTLDEAEQMAAKTYDHENNESLEVVPCDGED